jgi:gliding motility-associated-like protein
LSISVLRLLGQVPDCAVQNCCCGPEVEEIGVPCGDFEAPPIANPIIVVLAGQSYCDWEILSGSIDLLSPNFSNWASGNPNGASQFIDLNGNEPGVIATTLTGMQPGHTYTLTFWYARNGNTPSASADVLIAGGAWLNESFTATNHGADGWLEMCYTFVAQAATAELRLVGTNQSASGVILDDFNLWGCAGPEEPAYVTEEPEPLLQIPCEESIPEAAQLEVIFDCPGDVSIEFEETQIPQPCLFDIRRHWTITPPCEEAFELEQVIEVRDTEAPIFLVPPQNRTVNCGENILGEFYDWLAQQGGATAEDQCDNDLSWTTDYATEPENLCGETFVTFTVTDFCGNSVSAQAVFAVADDLPPVITVPAQDKSLFCPPSPQDSIDRWVMEVGGASAIDPCQPMEWSHDFDGDYTQEVITVTFTVTDGCGNTASTVATLYQFDESTTLLEYLHTCDPLEAGVDTAVQWLANCEIITITETVLVAPDTTFILEETCDPLTSGIFVETLAGAYCDSVVVLEIRLYPSDTTILTFFVCDPSQSGIDTFYLMNQYGCDSLVVHVREYTGQYVALTTIQICGIGIPYSDTLTITGGPCDSLFVTDYIYFPLDTTHIVGTTCLSTQAGLYVDVYTNIYGCDSMVITDITLLPSDTVLQQEVVCDAGAVQHDTLWLTNSAGCDSLVFIFREYGGIDTLFSNSLSCDSTLVGSSLTVHPGPYCDTIRVHTVAWSPYSLTFESRYSCESDGPARDTLRFTNQDGCDSLHVIERVYSDLAIAAIPQPETCAGYADGVIEVQVSGGRPDYEIRLAGGAWQSALTITPIAPGSYTVEVIDSEGCTRAVAPIIVAAAVGFVVDAGSDREVLPGDEVMLTLVSPLSPAGVWWTALDPIVCPTCPTTILGPVTQGQTVQVRVTDEKGCEGTDAFLLLLLDQFTPQVYIPNSFSPNFDGINDLFTIYGNDQISLIRSMAIYDRWGNALYYRQDIPVNSPSEGWDGTYRGKMMDPGVYVYVIELLTVTGDTRLYKGDLTLVR